MKTLAQAVVELRGQWKGIFDTLYWNAEEEFYYYANSDYEKQHEYVCSEAEFTRLVMEKLKV